MTYTLVICYVLTWGLCSQGQVVPMFNKEACEVERDYQYKMDKQGKISYALCKPVAVKP